MKRKLRKRAAVCFCAAQMAFQGTLVSYGAWQSDGTRWRYRLEDNGESVKSSWQKDGSDWYWFDGNGFMKTGWHLDGDGRWYFLNPISDGTKGRMMTGWHWIDGRCYYLEERAGRGHPLGAMYAGERTPDGYEVDRNGAWIDHKGQPVYRQGKGIVTAVRDKLTGVQKGGSAGAGSQDRKSKSPEKGSRESTGTKTGRKPDIETHAGTEQQECAQRNETAEDRKGQTGTLDTVKGESPPFGERQDTGEENGTDSGAAAPGQVNWQVYFTDSTFHQLHLAPSRSGTADEGADLVIYFQSKIVDAEKRIWKSLQESPYMISVSGPSDRIIYVEYCQTGETEQESDPWREERESLDRCLKTARKQEALLSGDNLETIPDSRLIVEDKDSCDMRIKSAASRIERGQSRTFYVIGKNYIPEGSVLAELYGDDMEYSNTAEDEVTLEGDIYILSRFQLYRRPSGEKSETVWSGEEKRHWKTGDVQERKLDGITYRFRCIDENYGDVTDRGKPKALFLCDTVIPADTGSSYVYEKKEDGTYGYRFVPGPMVCFGDSASYKYSRIRRWLKGAERDFGDTEEISAGVSFAYSGSTKPGTMKALSGKGLTPSYIGSQSMTDRLFILSVDEAVKYASWLWRFEGSEEENPESQLTTFCKGYWLRTPCAEAGEEKVYVVDLIQGNINPQPVRPAGGDDAEINATGTTGVRPAFTVEQR